jgi:hypothetical protein
MPLHDHKEASSRPSKLTKEELKSHKYDQALNSDLGLLAATIPRGPTFGDIGDSNQ